MHLLIASLLPLVLGSVLAAFLQRRKQTARGLDAFVLVSVGGLVCLYILPVAIARAGVWAVVAAAVGLAIPALSDRLFSLKAGRIRTLTWVVAMAAIAVHALMDGIALVPHVADHAGLSEHSHGADAHGVGSSLAMAVVLHRIPVALGVWGLVRPRFGLRAAIVTLSVIGGCSVLGYAGAEALVGWLDAPSLAAFQALVAGTLLHVVVGHGVQDHAVPQDHAEPQASLDANHVHVTDAPGDGMATSAVQRWHVASAFGGFVGIIALFVLLRAHPVQAVVEGGVDMSAALVALGLRMAWPLVGAMVVAAVASALFPASFFRRFRVPGGIAAFGIAWGLFGVGYAMLFAFAVVVQCAVIAFVGGVVVGSGGGSGGLRKVGPTGVTQGEANLARRTGTSVASIKNSISAHATLNQVRESWRELIGEILPWWLLGTLAASVIEPLVDTTRWQGESVWWQLLLLTALTAVVRVRAVALIPIAAVLYYKGIAPAAIVAAVAMGYSVSLLDKREPKPRWQGHLVLRWTVALVIGAVVQVIGPGGGTPSGPLFDMQQKVGQFGVQWIMWLQWAGVLLIGVLVAVLMLRRGTHGFVGTIVLNRGASCEDASCGACHHGCCEAVDALQSVQAVQSVPVVLNVPTSQSASSAVSVELPVLSASEPVHDASRRTTEGL